MHFIKGCGKGFLEEVLLALLELPSINIDLFNLWLKSLSAFGEMGWGRVFVFLFHDNLWALSFIGRI